MERRITVAVITRPVILSCSEKNTKAGPPPAAKDDRGYRCRMTGLKMKDDGVKGAG
jgi:hypothetical protein